MFAGIDSHKDLLVGAVVDDIGRVLSVESASNDPAGHQALLAWLGSFEGLERVGVECAGSYGRQLALGLQAAGVPVVEVPPRLTARERRRDRKAGKNDEQDAALIARIVAREEDLPPIRPTGVSEDLAAVLAHRDHLVGERTRIANRVHAALAQLHPGYAKTCPNLITTKALRQVRALVGEDPGVRAELVRAQVERLEALDREIKARTRQLAELVATSGSTLTQLCGAGPIVAARILVAVGDPTRFPTKNKFARG